jgi:purine-binding chemotaxis protein CheW
MNNRMETFKIVAFKLGEEEYGLDIAQVQSIERISPMTRIPNAPQYVKGVINLRGSVMPIIDLQSMLGTGETHYTEETRVIITQQDEIELGFIVDRTNDVIDVNPEEIDMTKSSNLDNDLFSGVLKYHGRLIIILKLTNLLKLNR